MKKINAYIFILFSLLNSAFATPPSAEETRKTENAIISNLEILPELFEPSVEDKKRKAKIKSVKINHSKHSIEFHFDKRFSEFAVREDSIAVWSAIIESQIAGELPATYSNYTSKLFIRDIPLESYIPNVYRITTPTDNSRKGKPANITPLTINTSKEIYTKGLSSRHIALWPSHGFVYETRDTPQEWKFQRPALFSTIEDLHTYQYTYNYLIPMLENSGAVVISARERSPQNNEVIVDNDSSSPNCQVIKHKGDWYTQDSGYLHIDTLLDENPHNCGTYLVSNNGGEIEFKATLPQAGKYGVTISYKSLPQSSDNIRATINHKGGETTILLNQQIGGSSWIYLGEWDFDTTASLLLSSESATITADAIRFGGGMGSVTRGGGISGMARWVEAARYYMQFSGVSKEVYLVGENDSKKDPKRKRNTPDKLDYVDDYKGRGEWVNYLREHKGIPIDLSIGIHTDAGIADSIVGTLSINFTEDGKGKLWDGSSKFASRDLSDMVQSEVVRRMHANVTGDWTRREIFDKEYSEVSRPTTPSMILEMFSHQNVYDMQFGCSPRVRFQISRAVYIGILKFLSSRYDTPYTVQPLPLKSFDMEMINQNTIKLYWSDNIDSLEPSATPTHYILYTRVGENSAFDNGVRVDKKEIEIPILRDGTMRSYRVAAVNDGGESFVSETLSCGFSTNPNSPTEVVVNKCKKFSPRVSYIWDYSYCGAITDRDKLSEFVDNENPGYGGSSKEFAGIGKEGETLDNTTSKGAEILHTGGNYISRSSGYNHWIRE